ncbi:MAG TPA: MFS transporter [Anaerolineaceae bacterium]|nr:MFS transporter [Anaerolineaceae bacterium]HOR84688.1 MFS transporter [Anaerolineaceae bacterium]HPL42361.1 MFS transporter [Anaerolineaceae bacterium]HQK42863.1 MFS transporter [Anaerolineaceae bacterium]
METKPAKPTRTRRTWLIYALLSLYVFMLNVPGPVTNYLKDEFTMSYTLSSLHFSAFAAGVLVTGLFGAYFIPRFPRQKVLAFGALGLGVGGLILAFGRSPAVTIAGIFLMGCIGTLILSIYPAILDEEMGARSPVGISEANTIASLFAGLAPLLVGFLVQKAVGWRPAVVLIAAVSLSLGGWLLLRFGGSPQSASARKIPAKQTGKLPGMYWIWWLALMLGIAVEYCIIYWGADYVEKVLGFSKNTATQSVSLFMAGMIIGRFFGSRLLERVPPMKLISGSISLSVFGFALFWSGISPLLGLVGLLLLGLGGANLYPVLVSMAIASAGELKAEAGARATLATGTAILFLPLVLGIVSDKMGIRLAYSTVGLLFVLLTLTVWWASRKPAEPALKPEAAQERFSPPE